MEKHKTTIYLPIVLKNAIEAFAKDDSKGRKFNQIIVDILSESKELEPLIKKEKEN